MAQVYSLRDHPRYALKLGNKLDSHLKREIVGALLSHNTIVRFSSESNTVDAFPLASGKKEIGNAMKELALDGIIEDACENGPCCFKGEYISHHLIASSYIRSSLTNFLRLNYGEEGWPQMLRRQDIVFDEPGRASFLDLGETYFRSRGLRCRTVYRPDTIFTERTVMLYAEQNPMRYLLGMDGASVHFMASTDQAGYHVGWLSRKGHPQHESGWQEIGLWYGESLGILSHFFKIHHRIDMKSIYRLRVAKED
jgi:hypothetical protein